MDEDGTIGVDSPILETDLGHQVVWLMFSVVWFFVAAGFFVLERPWVGLANLLLGLGGIWRSYHPP